MDQCPLCLNDFLQLSAMDKGEAISNHHCEAGTVSG